jgi:hypothetical protein
MQFQGPRALDFDLGDALRLVGSGLCCEKNVNCFLSSGLKTLNEAALIVKEIRNDMKGLDKDKKLDYQRAIVKNCVVSRAASSGYLSMSYSINSSSGSIPNEVCVRAFQNAYDISDYYIRLFHKVYTLQYTTLHYTILHYITLYYTILYYTSLYYTTLYEIEERFRFEAKLSLYFAW